MDTKVKGPLPVPKVAPEPLIKARVRPNNKYSGLEAGEIVEVTERELRRVKHALISLADEKRLEEEAAKAKPPTASQKMFRGLKKSFVAASEAQKESKAQQMKAHLETFGIKVG